MAALLNIESFFSALTGERQLEIDFPHDQYFRKVGVFVRLLFAAVLIGCGFGTSVTCYPPANSTYLGANEKIEELRASFVNAYCFSSGSYRRVENETNQIGEAELYLFNYYPYALILEAFLANLPYILYAVATRARIQPVLAEAADMVLLTSGAFEVVGERRKRKRSRGDDGGLEEEEEEEEDDSDFSEDENHYAKSLQTSMKKRLYAKMSLFVTQRLLVTQGSQLIDFYCVCHLVVKGVVVVAQIVVAVVMFYFSFPFPWQLSCPLSEALRRDTELEEVTCLFPYNQWIFAFVVIDIGLTCFLPLVSFAMHFRFWRINFYEGLFQASYLVHPNTRKTFREFVTHICTFRVGNGRQGRRVDDLRLILALLHSNVDQFIANKIMTVYAGRFHFEKSDKLPLDAESCGATCGACVAALRPKLRQPEWNSRGYEPANLE